MTIFEHLYPPLTSIERSDRQRLNLHKSCVLWFTGLSGSGKSTLAVALEKELYRRGIRSYILDGDRMRQGLNKDLDFTPRGRAENIRRLGETSKLMMDAGLITIVAAISPYQHDRDQVRQLFKLEEWFEVYVKCSLDVCRQRDPKGLYAKASEGRIHQFTGVDAPYEVPVNPDIVIDTEQQPVSSCVEQLYGSLIRYGILER